MKWFSLKNCWGEEFLNKCLKTQKSSWKSSMQEHCDTRNMEGSGYSNYSNSHTILEQSCPRIKLNPLPKVKNSRQGSSLSPSEWVMPQQHRLGMQEHTSLPWKSSTHFQCLISPKTQIQGCLRQVNTKTVQFWGLQRSLQSPACTRGNQEPAKPQRSRLQGQGTQGRSTAPVAQWCPEGQLGMLRSKTNTSATWALGQLSMLWLIMRPKMTEWRPSQRGFSPHNSELLMWELGRGGGTVHPLAFSGGL